MNKNTSYNQQALEIYHLVRAGKVNEIPNLSSEVSQKIKDKLPENQKLMFDGINAKSVNTFIKLAKTTSEEDFVKLMTDPDSVAIKLTPQEMEVLVGGRNIGLGIIGCASMIAIIGSFGLSAGGCGAGAAIYTALT